MRASQATSVTELGNFLTKVAQNIRVIFWAISREKWFGYVLGIIGEIGQLFIPSSGHTASNGHSVSVVPRLTKTPEQRCLWTGSGYGSLARAVASNARVPRFSSSHRHNLYWRFVNYQLYWRDENKSKRCREWPIKKIFMTCSFPHNGRDFGLIRGGSFEFDVSSTS